METIKVSCMALFIAEDGSALGQDIYVTRDDYETAIKIAKEFKISDSNDLGRIRRIRQIFAILVLLGYIFGIVMSILN